MFRVNSWERDKWTANRTSKNVSARLIFEKRKGNLIWQNLSIILSESWPCPNYQSKRFFLNSFVVASRMAMLYSLNGHCVLASTVRAFRRTHWKTSFEEPVGMDMGCRLTSKRQLVCWSFEQACSCTGWAVWLKPAGSVALHPVIALTVQFWSSWEKTEAKLQRHSGWAWAKGATC